MSAPKFRVGQMVMTRSKFEPQYDSDCTMILKRKFGRGNRTGYKGWFYQVDMQPRADMYYTEPSIRELPPPDKIRMRLATRTKS